MNANELAHPREVDIVIAGAGYIGLSLAVALKSGNKNLDIAVIDPAADTRTRSDHRASAIAAAARRLLERLEIWPELVSAAQPINSMKVTDSRSCDLVRPVLLTFEGDVAPGEAFAHMIANSALVNALTKRALAAGVHFLPGQRVTNFDSTCSNIAVCLENGAEIKARLLVAADGAKSSLRALAGIRAQQWRYPQLAIVTTMRHERPHEGCAFEHFFPAGPFATLPLIGEQSSLVWTEAPEDAKRIVSLSAEGFDQELTSRFGHQFGALKAQKAKALYPLGLILARDYVGDRFALLGDAAHAIHPIAGQGLNLGFKDVAALAQIIVEASRRGEDIGRLDILQRYETWRRFDNWRMGVITDLTNRCFSNDISPLRLARGMALGIIDRLPAVKGAFIRHAAGFQAQQPRLLQGEAL